MPPVRKKQKLSIAHPTSSTEQTSIQSTAIKDESKEDKSKQHRRSLFVRSLPASTTTESLTQLFSDSYPIKHATAVIDPETKQCRGYGFVTFADDEDVEQARKEFNGFVLDGKKLRIEVAEPRHRNPEKESAVESARESKRKDEKISEQQPPRLIIRNLPWTIKTPEQLSKLFLSYGKVKQAYLPKKASGLLSGFGFVLLRGRKNAEKAIEGVNGKEVDGRTLAVDWAVSKVVYQDATNADEGEETNGRMKHGALDQAETSDASGLPGDDDTNEEGLSDEDRDHDDDDDDQDSDGGIDIQVDGEDANHASRQTDNSSTLFIRNLPFTCMDEDLEDHFGQFGAVRYARVVQDAETGRSKGTGFVCFYDRDEASACVKNAPRRALPTESDRVKHTTTQAPNSILQNEDTDPSGQYTMDGRVLQISHAVDKSQANRLTEEGVAQRHKRYEDKRRLYLLSEGTIATNSSLWEQLAPSEQTMREASAKQRKALIESNPSLHLSLTRLSVRNIPRSIDSTELKALARQAIVGFATDVKEGARHKLSKEELARGGEEMREAEQMRKKAGKGIVKQAKVVFEGTSGSKVSEDSGAGRSRGYGFIEYYTHRSALMGLRWLNGHAVGYQVKDGGKGRKTKEESQDRKKRLIVEFAIENAQVVKRRQDSESKARERSRAVQGALPATPDRPTDAAGSDALKRKRLLHKGLLATQKDADEDLEPVKPKFEAKLARRNQIIGRKRALRRANRAQ